MSKWLCNRITYCLQNCILNSPFNVHSKEDMGGPWEASGRGTPFGRTAPRRWSNRRSTPRCSGPPTSPATEITTCHVRRYWWGCQAIVKWEWFGVKESGSRNGGWRSLINAQPHQSKLWRLPTLENNAQPNNQMYSGMLLPKKNNTSPKHPYICDFIFHRKRHKAERQTDWKWKILKLPLDLTQKPSKKNESQKTTAKLIRKSDKKELDNLVATTILILAIYVDHTRISNETPPKYQNEWHFKYIPEYNVFLLESKCQLCLFHPQIENKSITEEKRRKRTESGRL